MVRGSVKLRRYGDGPDTDGHSAGGEVVERGVKVGDMERVRMHSGAELAHETLDGVAFDDGLADLDDAVADPGAAAAPAETLLR